MENRIRVLIVDDEPALREILAARLGHWGYECREAADVREAEALLDAFDPDLVVSDVVMPGATGLELLRRLKSGRHRRLPVILVTAHAKVSEAVEAMKAGAVDFLTKPIDAQRLHQLVESVVADLERRREARALEEAAERDGRFGALVGRSAAMRELFRSMGQVASSDASALITGESGTGKELVARTIHDLSDRRAGPFVAINSAAMPETLIESELFGHEKGAFTGATRAREGCFEQADGGTLFLDELAEMPVALQPKLLRILEDARVRRLGANREVQVDVRLLAATNREPAKALAEGTLREDLYFRLNVFELRVPALRERADDLPLLAQHFIRQLNRKHRTDVEGLGEGTLPLLEQYGWPGNVRELRNVMERAVIVAQDGWIEPLHLPIYLRRAQGPSEPVVVVPVGTPAAEAEKQLILKTLEHVGNNKAEAARQLGLDVKTIRNKLRAFAEEEAGDGGG